MKLTSILVRVLIFITSISCNVIPFVIRLLYEEDYIKLNLDQQMLSTTLGKYLFHFINTEAVLANLVPTLFALIIVYLYYLTYKHSMSHLAVSELASGLFEDQQSLNSEVVSVYSKLDTPKFAETMISQEDYMRIRRASEAGEDDAEYRSLSNSAIKQLLSQNHATGGLEFDKSHYGDE